MRSARVFVLVVILAMVGGICLTSCSKDDGKPPCVSCSTDQCTAANAAMEQALYLELNQDPQRPSDIDFSTPAQLYEECLRNDPASPTAHFGVGLCGLLMLTRDAEVNAAFDAWKAYLDARVPFEVDPRARGAMGVPLGLSTGRTALRLPFDLVPLAMLAEVRTLQLPTDPQMEQVQQILETKVIPALTSAQTHLGAVAEKTDFVFQVTGRMQGDEEADPREIDQTDVLASRAACDLLLAACRVAVSYRVGLAAYDSTSLYQAFQRGSGWMALRSGGDGQMRTAGTDLDTAVNDLDRAVTSLLGETDSQDDDVIRIGPDDLARADVESLRVNLPHVREALSGGYRMTEDWDGDSDTPNIPLRINLGALFDNPVPDFKALLPSYTVRLDRQIWTKDFTYATPTSRITVSVPTAGSYYAYFNLEISGGEEWYSYFSGPEFLTSPLRDLVRSQVQTISAMPRWSGDFYAYGNVQKTLATGQQQVDVTWNYSYGVASQYVVYPVIVWDAERFEDWRWPDPTMHGFLPDIQSTSQLMATFGGRADNWQREWPVDWTNLDLGASTTPPHPGRSQKLAAVWSPRTR